MRKNGKMRKRVVQDDEIKVGSFFKYLIGISLVLVIFSLITMFATRDKKTNNDIEEIKIQYEKILVGSILNRSENDYYVLVEIENDSNAATYKTLIDTYTKKEEHSRFYYVDLGDMFNSSYVGSENNFDFTNILNVKFAESTLLHVKNGSVTSQRTGEDIMTYLQKISA